MRDTRGGATAKLNGTSTAQTELNVRLNPIREAHELPGPLCKPSFARLSKNKPIRLGTKVSTPVFARHILALFGIFVVFYPRRGQEEINTASYADNVIASVRTCYEAVGLEPRRRAVRLADRLSAS